MVEIFFFRCFFSNSNKFILSNKSIFECLFYGQIQIQPNQNKIKKTTKLQEFSLFFWQNSLYSKLHYDEEKFLYTKKLRKKTMSTSIQKNLKNIKKKHRQPFKNWYRKNGWVVYRGKFFVVAFGYFVHCQVWIKFLYQSYLTQTLRDS